MISLRLIHILFGAMWVGAVMVVTLYLLPAIRAAGPAGGQVMQEFVKRKFHVYMASLGGLTVLAGITMYVRDSRGTNGAFGASPAGMALGAGGVLGLVALIIGGAVSGRTVEALSNLDAQVQASGAPPSPAQAQEMQRLQARVGTSTRVVATLLLISTALMAASRYL